MHQNYISFKFDYFVLISFLCFTTNINADFNTCKICTNNNKTFTPFGDEQYLASSNQQLLTTGLVFLPENFKLNLDEQFYTSVENVVELSPLTVVRMFIRELKGLPRENLPPGSYTGGGEYSSRSWKKPAWSYFPYRLRRLAEFELDTYKILKKFYGRKQKLNFLALESYLMDFEESSLKTVFSGCGSKRRCSNEQDAEGYADPFLDIGSHPLLIFRMIRRFAEDLQPILFQLRNETDIIQVIYSKATDLELDNFPTTEDLDDSLEALVRIQKGSNLKTEEFARGILGNMETGIRLTALNALEIGAFHLLKTNYDIALEWLHLALETVSRSPKHYPFVTEFFRKMLEYAILQHNENWNDRKSILGDPGVFNESITPSSKLNISSYERLSDLRKIQAASPRLRMNSTWNWALPLNFAQLCSGVNLQTWVEKRNLRCWYSHDKHPYWKINPLKMELLNEEPPLFQMYGFMGERLMERMKEATVGELRRSTVNDIMNPRQKKVLVEGRTSVQTSLDEIQPSGRFLLSFTRKLELLTGLLISRARYPASSEKFQVASYGPSHHYRPHLDALEYGDESGYNAVGNRLVTIMGYLSDVAVGGRTAFPVLGTFADPIKGSLVMWRNLEKDGETRDSRTYHGGCPVVLGVKWITNKWILARDNMFRQSCKGTKPGKLV